MWPSSAPSAVVAGGGAHAIALPLGRGEPAREQADRRALDVALDARDLAGKAQPRLGAQAQRLRRAAWGC